MSIHEHAARGNIAGVERALADGVAVDERERGYGRTPLMAAAASPRAGVAMARLLVERGADVNARSWTPQTAPEHVAAAMSPDGVRYQFSGDTALTLAARTGDVDMVRFLLDAGADVRAMTTFGYDALINATYGDARQAGHCAQLVALLLERGARPYRATAFGETALKAAAGFAMFDVVALLLAAGADRTALRWTSLHSAVAAGDLTAVRAELAAGAALEARDALGRTALHLGLQVGDVDIVKALRAAGAELDPEASDAHSPLWYAITPAHSAVLAWLLAEGCDPDAAGYSGTTPLMEAVTSGAVNAARLLLEAGARADRRDYYGHPVIAEARDPEIMRLLLAHGADMNDVDDEVRPALFGIRGGDPLDDLPREAYLAGKERRFGRTNPEVMAVPFWDAMVRSREPAYAARNRFGDAGRCGDAPVWCFQRFGRTLTALPDGRYVEIAGEHEDFYDPDFCIYNDIVVYHGDGTFTLYGYPEEVFPPTDFHTATLVGTSIYLIGSLGYQGQRRPGETPVYRLDCESWRIEPVATRGTPPGWISRHTAAYDAERNRIVVSGGQRIQDSPSGEEHPDNTDTYALDLATQTWQRLPA